MAKIKRDDRCKDCKRVKIWSTNSQKATCTLYSEEGFHPDRQVPAKCIDKVERKY